MNLFDLGKSDSTNFQLYELSDDAKRKEWLDDWLGFMHRIGEFIFQNFVGAVRQRVGSVSVMLASRNSIIN